jgi:hypothetical protein
MLYPLSAYPNGEGLASALILCRRPQALKALNSFGVYSHVQAEGNGQ